MATLNYARAARTARATWAYTAREPTKPIGPKPPRHAQAAALYREINHLAQRISTGRQLIAELHPNDPRRSTWISHLKALLQERAKLKALFRYPAKH